MICLIHSLNANIEAMCTVSELKWPRNLYQNPCYIRVSIKLQKDAVLFFS